MDIYIHKDSIGIQHHLRYLPSGHFQNVGTELPDDATIIFGDPSLQEISKLYSLPLPSFPSPSHLKAFKTVFGNQDISQVPWSLAMPPRAFKEQLKGLGKSLFEIFGNLDLRYYQSHYKRCNKILRRLQPAKIDMRAWLVHLMDKKLTSRNVFETFQPGVSGYTDPVEYTRCDTKTGRMRVIKGPNILLLPREQRNILGSRFGFKGKVFSLDYSSLEPRLSLIISRIYSHPNSPLPGYPPLLVLPEDLYTMVMEELQITEIPRELIKNVVLSQLYGAGYDTIVAQLNGVQNPIRLIEALEEFFSLPFLRKRILEEYEMRNRQFIHNYFGRRIDTREVNTYMLLNYFTQSTAVDVVLHGFRNIFCEIQGNEKIIPLYILHDALILDVHEDCFGEIDRLCEIGSTQIPLFPGVRFPLKKSFF